MKTFSILLTSAGRRTSLLKSFAASARHRDWRLIAGDRDRLAPSLYLADDAIELPPVTSAEYISSLLEIVEREGVRLLVPTIDTELAVLAENSESFRKRNCVALISDPPLVAVSADKWLTVQTFAKAGIATPQSWLPDAIEGVELPEDLFVKPRDGSASQNAFPVTRNELDSALVRVPNAIVQERLRGREITIDALLDLSGRPIHFVPRTRIRTMSGESIQGVTECDCDIRAWVLAILNVCSSLGGRGPLTLQAFLSDRGPVLSEINPRFGGGFPLTDAAGGNYPEWIVRNVEGQALEPRFGEYRIGLYMTRYYTEHFTASPLWSR